MRIKGTSQILLPIYFHNNIDHYYYYIVCKYVRSNTYIFYVNLRIYMFPHLIFEYSF